MSQGPEGTPEERHVAAERQLGLLWNPPPPSARGPRRSLGLAEVVQAAVRVADAAGVEAMSMRKVAGELGIGAMSLYTYVPGRDELIELMIDQVSGEARPPDQDAPWREQLTTWATERQAMILRHGWVLDATATRDVLGPHSMTMSETLFRALLLTGLPPLDVVGTASAMLWFVNGAAGVVVGEEAATRRTGQTVEEYYDIRAGFWTTFFEYDRYPAHVHLWERGAFDDESGLDFDAALAAFLDGLELRVAHHATTRPQAPDDPG